MALQADAPRFEELTETLARVRGQRLVLLRNRGNRGDGVIHLGARRLLHALGLEYVDIHQPEAPRTIDADVLLVVAGGAFCRTTHSIVSVIERYAPTVQRVIILPASFDLSCGEVRRFARSWDERFTVFCREQRSFAALRALPARAQALMLSHDLAFCADLQPWAERPAAGSVAIVRRDREAVFDRRPLDMGGRDISRGSDAEAEVLLDYVARFAVVHTDRTHAAITAAMMGRDVWLYRNAYFKNEAIFEHSLSRMPNVRFVGKQAFSLRQCGAALYTHYVQRNAYLLRKRWREWKAGRSAA
jgi:exopolysaccharide biosynthesis predicted pyruvyltransferase EpsI